MTLVTSWTEGLKTADKSVLTVSAQSGDFLIPQLRELESELDEERKARVNAVTLKKKIETDMKDLEEQFEAANRVKEDGLRQLKKYQQQVKDIQRDLDEARQARDEISEQAKDNERKAKQLEADYVQMQEVSHLAYAEAISHYAG